MKFSISPPAVACCVALLLAPSALPQSLDGRPRQAAAASERNVPARASFANATIDSVVPRDEIQFYMEVRKGALMELAGSANSLTPLMSMFGANHKSLATGNLAQLVMGNLATLSNAKLAFVGLGRDGMAVLVESDTEAGAEKLGADLSRLLDSPQAGANTAEQLDVALQGRVVMAGTRSAVALLTERRDGRTLGQDQEIMSARAKFLNDPLFAYVEVSAGDMLWPTGGDAGQNPAYMAGAMAALNSMPYAVAMGGRVEGDSVNVRALMLFTAKQKDGLFSSVMSSAQMGEPTAANFVAPGAELFVDTMVSWDKLFESVEYLLTPESTPANSNVQTVDLLAMMESSLGFSIRRDLLPTLGTEVAISLKGMGEYLTPKGGPSVKRAALKAMPQFTVMVAVKDGPKFERLLSRMFSQMGTRNAPSFSQAFHRGARISYNSSVAYTVSRGFFIIAGSLADIRQALDVRATGASLAAAPDFRAAMGATKPALMQLYMSSGMSRALFNSVRESAMKANVQVAPAGVDVRGSLGVLVTPDANNWMIEMRAPTTLATMMMSAMIAEPRSPNGMNSGSQNGSGGTRRVGGKKTPKLTNDDLRKP